MYQRQRFAVGLRRRQGHAVAAIAGHRRGAQHRAGRIGHADRRASLAAAAHHRAVAADRAGRRDRRRDVGRDRRHPDRHIAGGIRLRNAQRLAIQLRRRKRGGIAAIGGHRRRADDGPGRIGDADRGAGFTGTGHERAIGRNRAGRRIGCRNVRRGDRHLRRHIACAVRLHQCQRLTIGLRFGQRDAIIAVGRHGRRAQHGPGRIGDADDRTRLTRTRNFRTIGRDRARRRGRRGNVRRNGIGLRRGIARRIGLNDTQRLAIQLRRGKDDDIGAIGPHRRRAQQRAIGIGDADRRPGLASTGHGRTIGCDGAGRCIGRRNVGRGDVDGDRRIAGRIGLNQRQRLAIGERRVQRHTEIAVIIDRDATQRHAIGIRDGDRRPRLAGAGHRTPVKLDRASRRSGRFQIGRRDRGRAGLIACRVGLRDVQGRSVGLRRGQCCRIMTLAIDGRGADHCAVGITHRYGRALLARSGHDGTGRIDLRGRRKRWGDIGRGQDHRDGAVSIRIGLYHDQLLAIGLRRAQGDAVIAIPIDDRRSQCQPARPGHGHRRADLASAGHRIAGGGDGRRHRIGRVGSIQIGGSHRQFVRHIACRVALHHGQRLAMYLWRRKQRAPEAGAIHYRRADLPTGWIGDDDRGTDFTRTAHRRAIAGNIGSWRFWCGKVGRRHIGRVGYVAGAIRLGDAQRLAIQLRRGQHDTVIALCIDDAGAQQGATCRPHLDCRSGDTRAGHEPAGIVDSRGRRRRRRRIVRRNRHTGRYIAGHIALRDAKNLAIDPCRAEREEIIAVIVHDRRADDRTRCVANGDGRANLARAADRRSVRRYGRARCCRRRQVRRADGRRIGHIASRIDLRDRQRFAFDQRR